MRRLIVLTLLLASCGFSSVSAAQTKIIFDTDFGGDADDLGALAMLHHYVDRDMCDLLGIMIWSTEKYAVPAVDAVNRYYNHPDIPVGVRKGDTHVSSWNYNEPLAKSLPYKKVFETVPDANRLYREILSQEEDGSVVIVTVGPLKNIQNLLESSPDKFSDLDGKELVTRKVKEFVVMGGKFPEGEGEWNFYGGMEGVTHAVLESLPVPVVFLGYEIGVVVKTGSIFNSMDKDSPLHIGFLHFSRHAPWMKDQYQGKILDNASFDQTAVLYAVEGGVGKYWEMGEPGHVEVDKKGNNKWIPGEESNQAYLRLISDLEPIAKRIEDVMLGKF